MASEIQTSEPLSSPGPEPCRALQRSVYLLDYAYMDLELLRTSITCQYFHVQRHREEPLQSLLLYCRGGLRGRRLKPNVRDHPCLGYQPFLQSILHGRFFPSLFIFLFMLLFRPLIIIVNIFLHFTRILYYHTL